MNPFHRRHCCSINGDIRNHSCLTVDKLAFDIACVKARISDAEQMFGSGRMVPIFLAKWLALPSNAARNPIKVKKTKGTSTSLRARAVASSDKLHDFAYSQRPSSAYFVHRNTNKPPTRRCAFFKPRFVYFAKCCFQAVSSVPAGQMQ